MPKYTCPKCSTRFSVDESSDSDEFDFDDTFGKEVTITEDITDRSSVRPKQQESVTKENWIFGDDYIIANITGYWDNYNGDKKDMRKFKLKNDHSKTKRYFCKVYPNDKPGYIGYYGNDYWLYFIEKEDNDQYYMYNERIASPDSKVITTDDWGNGYKGYELFKTIKINHQ